MTVTALPLETQPLDFRYSYTMISQEASQLGLREIRETKTETDTGETAHRIGLFSWVMIV